jgi:hypothetical protein
VHRRQFLTVAAGTLASLAGGKAFALPVVQNTTSLEPTELLGMLGPQVVRLIGVSYRTAAPHESTTTALRTALLKDLIGSTRESVTRSLTQRVLDDFAAGRTVIVSGWLLAVTEARQCALFSLVSPA